MRLIEFVISDTNNSSIYVSLTIKYLNMCTSKRSERQKGKDEIQHMKSLINRPCVDGAVH